MARKARIPARVSPLIAAAICGASLLLPGISGQLSAQEPTVETNPPETRTDTSPPETEFFFGDAQRFDPNGAGYLEREAFFHDETSGIAEENDENAGWDDQDISPLFPELRILDEVSVERSMARLRDARNQYLEARRELRLGEERVGRERENFSTANARYDWERHDLRMALERRERQIEGTHRNEAISHLVRSMRLLDQIQNPGVLESEPYLELKASVLREYVKQQFRARNLDLCVDALEDYMALGPARAQEPEAHRLLATCYRYREVMAERMRDRENRLEYKRRKNEHLLSYARLRFGEDSTEFQVLSRRVQRDMYEFPEAYQ